MKFSFYTLGCKVNQYETNSLKEMVLDKGFDVDDQDFDIFVINTCTVTAVSDKKNLKIIKKAKKDNPNAIIAVCGCFAQVSSEKIEDVDIICGTDRRADVIDMCIDSFQNKTKHIVLQDTKKAPVFEVLPVSSSSNRTRGLLKIQDGCNNFCTYCIIPYARGRSRSMPVSDVLSQTLELSKLKTREIIITGIEIASYGLDIGTNIVSLLEKLCSSFPEIRFRLGSLEPRIVTDEFCEVLSKYDNLCPHFHLSLQSGCDTVLKRMNRRYNTEFFYEVCVKLRKYFKNPSITTDLIVGFPQESEDEFLQTMAFIKKCNFSSMHIFPYSIRENTKASIMEGQINQNIKNSRTKQATELANAMENQFLQTFIGENLDILVEKPSNGKFSGHSKYHFAVECQGDNFLQGNMYNLSVFSTNSEQIVCKK